LRWGENQDANMHYVGGPTTKHKGKIRQDKARGKETKWKRKRDDTDERRKDRNPRNRIFNNVPTCEKDLLRSWTAVSSEFSMKVGCDYYDATKRRLLISLLVTRITREMDRNSRRRNVEKYRPCSRILSGFFLSCHGMHSHAVAYEVEEWNWESPWLGKVTRETGKCDKIQQSSGT